MEGHPKFRPDIKASEQKEPGRQTIIVLKDPVTESYFRVSPFEYRLLRALNGRVTVAEAVEKLKSQGYYYDEADSLLIVAKAAEYGLLLGTRFGTAQFQRHLKTQLESMRRQQRLASLYYLFIPLINPDAFLGKTVWVFKKLVNKWTGLLMLLLLPGALYLAVVGAYRIEHEYLFFFNLRNLIYLWITIAFTKLVHEFAHAYTAKSYGLRVPQMGLAFLIFFPCLYCNTTDAWQLADRKQRMAISGAGILAEGSVAIAAAYVWYFSRPGMVNSLAFYLMAVSFVSTVLFNGNPLLKFDGYFLLMDYLRIPNMAAKSMAYLKYLFMNRVLGSSLFPNPAGNPREVFIFACYGTFAFLYRVFLYGAIVVGIYYRFNKLLAVVLAILALGVLILRPILRGTRTLFRQKAEIRPRLVGSVVFILILAAIGILLSVPISSRSVYPCYLESARTQKLTVPLKTSVKDVLIRDGMPVKKGALLFTLDSSELKLDLGKKQLDRKIVEQKIQQMLLDEKQLARTSELEIQLRQLNHKIKLLKKDLSLANTGIVAPFSGVLAGLDYRLQNGFRPGEGAIVGELKSTSGRLVHILVPEKDLHKMRLMQDVEVWFPVPGTAIFNQKIVAVKPYNERDLKDSPFSSRHGGEIATEMKDSKLLDAPLEAQYVCYADFSSPNPLPLGTTGKCAIRSAPRSVLSRLIHHAVQTFNRESIL